MNCRSRRAVERPGAPVVRKVCRVTASGGSSRARAGAISAAVLLASLVLGGLTSFGQSLLPAAVSSLSNSASGWTLLTALLVWSARRSTAASALLGALCFVALTVGYALISTARGFPDDTLPWSVIGLVVGPFVGVAATWQRERGVRRGLGAGLLAGVGVGDGLHGLTALADTTSPVYWTVILVIAVVLAVAAAIRAGGIVAVVVEVATLVVVAGLMNLVYRLL